MNDLEELTKAGEYARELAAKARHPVMVLSNRRKTSAPVRKPYTPQFSELATVSVRRLAWAMGEKVNMPAAVNRIIELLPRLVPAASVCPLCRDKTKCLACIFSQAVSEQENTPVSL
jgi:hypothetical protein